MDKLFFFFCGGGGGEKVRKYSYHKTCTLNSLIYEKVNTLLWFPLMIYIFVASLSMFIGFKGIFKIYS